MCKSHTIFSVVHKRICLYIMGTMSDSCGLSSLPLSLFSFHGQQYRFHLTHLVALTHFRRIDEGIEYQ